METLRWIEYRKGKDPAGGKVHKATFEDHIELYNAYKKLKKKRYRKNFRNVSG